MRPAPVQRCLRAGTVVVGVAVAALTVGARAVCAFDRVETVRPNPTVVSLEFDDARANAYAAMAPLAAHGMHATFFVPSGLVATPGYMSWSQLADLARDGNEIGGHTITHPHLPALVPDEQRRQICNDRVTLASHHFRVTDFAYPYGEYDATTQQAARDCGYSSARTVDGIATANECTGECPAVPVCANTACPNAESIPPADIFAIRTPGAIGAAQTLAGVEAEISAVTSHGGGWLNLVFHQLCSGCDPQAFSPSDFTALLDWLATRAFDGVVVQTVREVVGANALPPTPGTPAPAARSGAQLLQNGSLERWTGALPDCFEQGGYGTNTVTFARNEHAHHGRLAVTVQVTSYRSGDQKLVTAQDQGACSPSIVPGRRYHVGVWYESNAQATLTLFYRDAVGRWVYWASSPTWAPTSTWRDATWTTPPAPPAARALSFGLTISEVGSITTDDYVVSYHAPSNLRLYLAVSVLGFVVIAGEWLFVRRRRSA